jgi:hypothetical protein
MTYSFKKVHPAIAIVLTNITLGAYVPFWFLSRRKSVEQLFKTNINYKSLYILLFLYIFMALYYFMGKALFTELGANLVETINLWITFIGLGITYYSVFRFAEAIEQELDDIQFNKTLLILFHIWYLQFKINKIPNRLNAINL